MDNEEMAAQLRTLTELVQQLQADNTKLREEVAQRSVPPTPDSLPGQSPRPGPVNEAVRPAPTGVVERYVYIPRERKCPRFSGRLSHDSLTVEDWVEEARRHLSSRHMPLSEQVLTIFDLLDGEARTEVKFRPASDRDDPDKIFGILTSIYGCSHSYISLQKQFFQRRQLAGESLREYSHALMHMMEAVKRRDPVCFANPDVVLRDQFIEHVGDSMLKRELRRQVRLHPTITFYDVRSEAIRWVEEGEHSSDPRPRAHSCSTNVVQEHDVDSNAVSVKPTNELTELKESLRKQQSQLDTILRRLDSPLLPDQSIRRPLVRSSRYRFQADGKPICLRCNQPGHIARFCQPPNAAPRAEIESHSLPRQQPEN
ncbi:uncharacterized protein LOC121714900 [Alosa sapidissima]|uniref:uncharacterized protein LOC121684175 n=1 Tax=Alosa sapidissima TaxID=34773 RepID=UPI001C08F1D1|nr:uncharacterized protein LOC121684175 [Alosa sapidissima]XP_041956027.1 uncharacterized protein LOC121714900 [Alosa sapidissima]XP_041956028.1 uncharacterized protein LOC121714900 [Alosa sapidissima]XP_041956029.1 uncharacterized protein LOC121714900 [Alosa sapidissima]XP_041956030.1 uncharacterized protein LOC121714900 [Alosa sapidissima]